MAPRAAPNAPPPDNGQDRPRFGRLGWIAALCFVLGLAWPSLARFQLVQRPPGSAPPKSEEVDPPPDADPEPNTAPASAPPSRGPSPLEPRAAIGAVPAAHTAPVLTEHETLRVEGVVVESCRDAADRPLDRCDTPDLAQALEKPVRQLARCDGSEGASGVLSLGLELDFAKGHVTHVEAGHSTSLSKGTTAALLGCAKDLVVGIPLGDVAHRHGRYWLYYSLRFRPPGSAVERDTDTPSEAIVSASGRGTIGAKTAVVRQAPSLRAKISARLLYGARVKVTGRAGEWYRVDYDGKGSIGWVQREAIGM